MNDTKGTNIDATMSGLGSYKGKKIYLILGGDDKGANLRPLFDFLQDFNIEIFIIGSNFKRLITLCKEYSFMYFYEGNYIKTLEKIDSKLDLESVGILSPAASSLDQFTSYAQRGNIFKEFVRNLRLN